MTDRPVEAHERRILGTELLWAFGVGVGERRNDVYGRMRFIAAKLTPAEIDGLAAYYRAGFK